MKTTLQPPKSMTDDLIMEEIVDIVRQGRSFGRWDRTRLRSLSSEAQRRKLINPKKMEDMQQP